MTLCTGFPPWTLPRRVTKSWLRVHANPPKPGSFGPFSVRSLLNRLHPCSRHVGRSVLGHHVIIPFLTYVDSLPPPDYSGFTELFFAFARGSAATAMNLPNSLTVLRIFFVPLLAVVLLTQQPNWNFWGLSVHFEVWGVLILMAAATTDMFDGYLARKRGEITTLGILLDPIADKLLISAVFISLVEMGLVPGWMVLIIIGREFIITGLRNIASAEGLIIPASALGKVKMILQVIAGAIVILGARHPVLKPLGTILLWAVVLSAIASAIHYFHIFWGQVDDRVKQRHRRASLVLEQEKNAQDATTIP
jgi:CDP-diacylglycerol--glycerol-3-phosphate 3-phosphatidyltransferase